MVVAGILMFSGEELSSRKVGCRDPICLQGGARRAV